METREMVLKALEGDKKCFTELVLSRKDMLYKTAYLYVKSESDALEIVDETVYKAYISIKTLKNPEYFYTWLTRILINSSLNFLKHNKKIVPIKDDVAIEENYDTHEVMDLYNAVDKLNGNLKTVIILKYFYDLKIIDIAEVMECSESNVKNYLHKALNNLRIDLNEEGEYVNDRI